MTDPTKMTLDHIIEHLEWVNTVECHEAARRLRNSVPKELYDKAWEECRAGRLLRYIGSRYGGKGGYIENAAAHDAARAAHAAKEQK